MPEAICSTASFAISCEEAGISIGTFYHHFQKKNDLLMQFVRDASFESFVLETPLGDVPGRVCELNMRLIGRYLAPGEEFMKRFYTTGYKSLSANMEQSDGCLAEGTVMARCEKELRDAQTQGFLKKRSRCPYAEYGHLHDGKRLCIRVDAE